MPETPMAPSLPRLPPEILHGILSYVNPEDLARLPLACRRLHDFVKGNKALCRAIYLRILDEPPSKDIDWEQELRDLVRLTNICLPKMDDAGDNEEDVGRRLQFVHRTVTRLLEHATAVPSPAASAPTPSSSSATTTTTSSTLLSRTKEERGASRRGNDPSARISRAQTYPASRNAALLSRLFARASTRRALLARSFLHERGRVLGMDGFDRLGGASRLANPGAAGAGAGAGASGGGGGGGGNGIVGASGSAAPRRQLQRGHRDQEQTEEDDPTLPRLTSYGWAKPARPRAEYQLSARLRCLYGWDLGELEDDDGGMMGRGQGRGRGRSRAAARRGRAILRARHGAGAGAFALASAKVYDMREYTPQSAWGPFRDDPDDPVDRAAGSGGGGGGLRVDWEKVEALLIVLGTNMRLRGFDRYPLFWHLWARPFGGAWANSYIPWTSAVGEGIEERKLGGDDEEEEEEERKDGEGTEAARELARRDPYGVSGTWLRVVCFMDYMRFFNFNFPLVDPLPRAVPRDPLHSDQATLLIAMRLRVVAVEPPGAGDHPGFPVVRYAGVARALDRTWDDGNGGASLLRGAVRTTPEGEVRWTSCSVVQGQERWRSEGVQLGGIRSARGVVGTWFDKDYSDQGPVGPNAYWKISDREVRMDDTGILREDLLPLLTICAEGESEAASDGEGDEASVDDTDARDEDWDGDESEGGLEDELEGVYHFWDLEDLEMPVEEEGTEDEEGA